MPVDQYIAALKDAIRRPENPEALTTCERAARAMGLVHSLKDLTIFRVDRPELLSPVHLGREPSSARRFAGTENAVFFYVGPTAMTRDRAGALVFRAELEDDGVVATPWDSGGLHRLRAQHLNEAQRFALLKSRTLPTAKYRRALAMTILLRFGGDPKRYLQSELFDATDPDGVCDGTPPSFTYEARLPGRVGLQTPELALVLVRREYLSEGLHRLRTWCSERHIPFEFIDEHSRSRTVHEGVLDYSLRQLT